MRRHSMGVRTNDQTMRRTPWQNCSAEAGAAASPQAVDVLGTSAWAVPSFTSARPSRRTWGTPARRSSRPRAAIGRPRTRVLARARPARPVGHFTRQAPWMAGKPAPAGKKGRLSTKISRDRTTFHVVRRAAPRPIAAARRRKRAPRRSGGPPARRGQRRRAADDEDRRRTAVQQQGAAPRAPARQRIDERGEDRRRHPSLRHPGCRASTAR